MVKSSKIWKIVWIGGIYVLLIVILYLIIVYKVEWEDKDLNTYLYIYDCGNDICTSTTSQDNYYNKVLCENDVCPYIDEIIDNNLILRTENNSWIYDYVQGKIIDNNYVNYRFIGNNMYVVNDDTGKYGIIDGSGLVLVDLKYDYIDDYKDGYISYIKNNLYGIANTDMEYNLEPVYEDIVLISDKIFAGKKENVYQLHSYQNVNDSNSNKYDYVYSYNGVIFVINNKKVDILDTNLNSTLLMKIDCFYGYTTEKERDSLKIYSDNDNIYFRIYTSEEEYTEYTYSVKNKKLI